MASDTMRQIAEAEERAAVIERNADNEASDLVAKAESAAAEKVREFHLRTQDESRRILDDAEAARMKEEAAALLTAEEKARELRSNVAPRIPEAVAAVRDILIGKV